MEYQFAFQFVRTLTNDVLRDLVKELHKIYDSEKPALVPMSQTLKKIYEIEKKECRYWTVIVQTIDSAIKNEIFDRIREDKF